MKKTDQHLIWIEVIQAEMEKPCWNTDLLLCWQLSGNSTIYNQHTPFRLIPDTLLLISPYRLYNLEMLNGQILLFHIDIFRMDSTLITGFPMNFSSLSDTPQEEQKPLKILLAHLTKMLSINKRYDYFLIYSHICKLLYELCIHFTCKSSSTAKSAMGEVHNMETILRFMSDNYTRRLSVEDLGKEFYMSPAYFARMFKNNLDITPRAYLTRLRLNHARKLLREDTYGLVYISDTCGFPDVHSFIHAFKQVYNQTPGQYRKSRKIDIIQSPSFTQEDLSLLDRYLNINTESLPVEADPEIIQIEVQPVSFKFKGMTMPKTGTKFIIVDHFSDLLQANIQDMLRRAQNEIGFEYVYFHGLLDDSIPIYMERGNSSNPYLIYPNLDYIFDFLISINLKPMVEFSYMPRHLALEQRMTLMIDKDIISMPKSLERWSFLVRGIIEHLLFRYGKKQVTSWLFCSWPLPDFKITPYCLGSDENFYVLYSNTWHAIKSVDSDLQVGIPNMVDVELEDGSWFTRFLEYCYNRNCIPDFMGYHFYSISRSNLPEKLVTFRKPLLSTDSSALNVSIKTVKALAKKFNWNIPRLYIPVWDFCFSSNPLEDTSFRAVYIIKNILENMALVDGLGCLRLADQHLHSSLQANTYSGLPGLFTDNNIPKASYYAYTLFSRLGDQILSRGDGWCVTRCNDKIQILLYYYQHFSEEYAKLEHTGIANTDRYLPFAMDTHLKIILPLTDLPNEHYLAIETIINRNFGSSFDKWFEMGSLCVDTPEIIEYLRKVSTPKISNRRLNTEEGKLELTAELEPLEIRLIELRPE